MLRLYSSIDKESCLPIPAELDYLLSGIRSKIRVHFDTLTRNLLL